MEDQAAVHRIIHQLEPLLKPAQPLEQRARAQVEYNATEERYSHELDPARKGTLVRELARCEGHLGDIEKQEDVKKKQDKAKVELLQEQLHRLLSKRYGGSTPPVQQRSEQPYEDGDFVRAGGQGAEPP